MARTCGAATSPPYPLNERAPGDGPGPHRRSGTVRPRCAIRCSGASRRSLLPRPPCKWPPAR